MKTTQDPGNTGKNDSEKATNVAYRGYKDGTAEFFGEQILALTGYHKDEFNNKRIKWVDLIYEADQGRARESFVRALKGDKTYMRDYRIRHREGGLVWFREWGQIICDAEGKVESILGVILDVTEQKLAEEAQAKIDRLTGKYLMFMLGSEQFAVSILRVREIIGMLPITTIPRSPDYLRGVINLRGKVIPVVNLRLKLGMEDMSVTDRTCIVLVEVLEGSATRVVGLVVDAVSEVVHVQGNDIDESPELITSYDSDYIMGMAKIAGKIKILLDVDRLNLGADLTQLDPADSPPGQVA